MIVKTVPVRMVQNVLMDKIPITASARPDILENIANMVCVAFCCCMVVMRMPVFVVIVMLLDGDHKHFG